MRQLGLPRAVAVALLALSACRAPEPIPGMTTVHARPLPEAPALDELARVEPAIGTRALLVVYPRTACSGSARTVFIDRAGRFLGAVGPGEAALLSVPSQAQTILATSSVDVTAHEGAWFFVDEIEVPPAPSGILLETMRRDARQCSNGHHSNATIATKSQLEAVLGEAPVRWLTPDVRAGQAWLGVHRRRVAELTGVKASPRPRIVTHTFVP